MLSILEQCGNKIGDRYIILNQEFWEDCSCYYTVSRVIDWVFKTKDSSTVFCNSNDNICDRKYLINTAEPYEIFDNLRENGVDIPEEVYDEDEE